VWVNSTHAGSLTGISAILTHPPAWERLCGQPSCSSIPRRPGTAR